MIKIDEAKSEKKQISEHKDKELSRLRKLLKAGVVEFTYKKKDGSLRKAKGTLKKSLLPELDNDDENKRKTNDDCFVYYDLKRDDYRCFLKKNFIEIKDKK